MVPESHFEVKVVVQCHNNKIKLLHRNNNNWPSQNNHSRCFFNEMKTLKKKFLTSENGI